MFNQKSEAPTPQEMMMSNPDMMMNMMKGNITGFLPQVLLEPHAYRAVCRLVHWTVWLMTHSIMMANVGLCS